MSGPFLAISEPVLHRAWPNPFEPAGSTCLSRLTRQWVPRVHHLLCKEILSFISYKSTSYLFHRLPLALASQHLVISDSKFNSSIAFLIFHMIITQPSAPQSEVSDFLDTPYKAAAPCTWIIWVAFLSTCCNSTTAFLGCKTRTIRLLLNYSSEWSSWTNLPLKKYCMKCIMEHLSKRSRYMFPAFLVFIY